MTRRLQDRLSGLGIRTQIAMLLIGTQVLAHLVTFAFMLIVSSEVGRKSEVIVDLADPMLTALRVLDDDLADVQTLAARDARFVVADAPPPGTRLPEVNALLRAELADPGVSQIVTFALDEGHGWPPAPRIQPYGLAKALTDGSWLVFTPRPDLLARTMPKVASLLALSLLALPLMLLSVWAATWLVAPITRLSAATRAFAGDIRAPDLAEEGAREVRNAIAAFNNMQHRLRRMIEDRSQTLASIGHDMRTPLTRLRLRLETVDLGDTAPAVERDLSTLERMIDDALRFMRDDQHAVDMQIVDVSALCQTAVDGMRDQGHDIQLRSAGRVIAICDMTLTMRVLDNILSNAVTHGKGAVVNLHTDTDTGIARVTITDTGPGIPPHLMEFVQKPFSRLTAVAAGDSGEKPGFGLGLAIASDLMKRQSGTLELAANAPRGLKATLSFSPQRHAA